MSVASEVTERRFIYKFSLRAATSIFDKKMKDCSGNLELSVNLANLPVKCRKFHDALDLYDHCCRIGEVSSETVKQVSYSLLESMINIFDESSLKTNQSEFVCAICESVLRQPTTTPCGHTFCKKCLLKDKMRTCKKCGQTLINNGSLETNILIKSLVEKLWSVDLLAADLRDEGNELLHRNELDAAIEKFNEALTLECNESLVLNRIGPSGIMLQVPDDPFSLCYKSQVLYRLGKFQAALQEAENVIKLRPHWGKGYLRRGFALLALGAYEEALTAFCVFVALEKNPQQVRHDVCKILHVLLSDNTLPRRLYCSSPFASSPEPRLRRARYFHHRTLLNRSNGEDHSSGEEDFIDGSITYPTSRSSFYFMIGHIFEELEKLKKIVGEVIDLNVEPQLVEKSDFDCVLCCRTLWKPVTTPCGHSYCLVCLDRSLDYSSSCPLCMKSLADYVAVTPKNTTKFLCKAVKTLFPAEYLSRRMIHQAEISELVISHAEKQPKIPVFVCTTAYPSIHCPLFIYEPRYRLMIRRCVEAGTRQFGIAACFMSEDGSRRYADYGTILEIKDWVLMSDGCSILSTIGVRRFRTISRSERDGYDTARIEFLTDDTVPEACLQGLKDLHDKVRSKALSWMRTFTEDFQEQVVSSFGTIPDVENNWSTLPDGPSWTWWLLTILPLGPQLQVSILGTTRLEKRLRAIDKTLDQIQDRLQPQAGQSKAPNEEPCSSITVPRVEAFSLSTNCPFRRS